MYLFNFNLLPLLVFVPALYFVTFLIFFFIFKSPKRIIFPSASFAGFFGFFIFLPIPFYDEYFYHYFLVPITFASIFFLSSLMCLLLNISFFKPNSKIFEKKIRKKIIDDVSFPLKFSQSSEDSFLLADSILEKFDEPHKLIKNFTIFNGNEAVNFPYLLIVKQGIFTIFPCNWSGKIQFYNGSLARFSKDKSDIKTISVFDPFKEKVLKSILEEVKLSNKNLHKIILTTNPTSKFDDNERTSFASLVDLGDFKKFINNFPCNNLFSESEINSIHKFLKEKELTN